MSTPGPYALWQKAGGNMQLYRESMIKHGYLADLSSRKKHPPAEHKFAGKDPKKFCAECGGRKDEPWHV
jgi:hypothetical protein